MTSLSEKASARVQATATYQKLVEELKDLGGPEADTDDIEMLAVALEAGDASPQALIVMASAVTTDGTPAASLDEHLLNVGRRTELLRRMGRECLPT